MCPSRSRSQPSVLLAAPPRADAGSEACNPYADAPPSSLAKRSARQAVACLIRLERARAGLGALRRNRRLTQAAQSHSRAMHRTCFAHQCDGEPRLRARLHRAGYLNRRLRRFRFGENIAWGGALVATPRGIVDGWMRSPAHRAHILDPSMRQFGIGFARGRPDQVGVDGGLYTVDFGLRQRR